MSGKRIGISLVAAFLSCSVVVTAQVIRRGQAADTPESAALRGMGAFLRGAGSYNLNTAKAESIATDTLIRWKQDLRKIDAERRALRERAHSHIAGSHLPVFRASGVWRWCAFNFGTHFSGGPVPVRLVVSGSELSEFSHPLVP